MFVSLKWITFSLSCIQFASHLCSTFPFLSCLIFYPSILRLCLLCSMHVYVSKMNYLKRGSLQINSQLNLCVAINTKFRNVTPSRRWHSAGQMWRREQTGLPSIINGEYIPYKSVRVEVSLSLSTHTYITSSTLLNTHSCIYWWLHFSTAFTWALLTLSFPLFSQSYYIYNDNDLRLTPSAR